jgi:hypothetical protein
MLIFPGFVQYIVAEFSVIDSAHRHNILRLIDEFGESRQNRIIELYSSLRDSEESTAKITDFTPIFTYRMVREALEEESRIASPY